MSKQCQINTSKKILIGYNISHSHCKRKKKFIPNIQKYSFISKVLKGRRKFYAAVKSVKIMKLYPSFDAYIVKTENKKLTEKSIRTKKKILKLIKDQI